MSEWVQEREQRQVSKGVSKVELVAFTSESKVSRWRAKTSSPVLVAASNRTTLNKCRTVGMSVLRATRVLLGDDRCGRSQPTCKINLDNASAHNLRWVGFARCCVTLEDLGVKRGDLEEDIFAIVARHVLGSDHDVPERVH